LYFAEFGFQAVPPAPGRAETTTGQPVDPAGKAPPGGPEGGAPPGGLLTGMFPFLLVGLLVFLLWSQRSQSKKQEAAISALKKGDRVVTSSGLVGRLVEVDPKYVKVEIAPGVKVQMLRSSLTGRDTDEAPGKEKEKEKAEATPEKKA